jgi:hypothetical protein
MKISKDHVLEVLRTYGTPEQIRLAEQDLRSHVDTDDDGDLLRELGIDPDDRAQGGSLAPREGGRDDHRG